MMRPAEDVEVYLCRDPVDMRKSINGLSILVEQALALDPFRPHLFVFCNRKRDKLKILYWERTGFVLWYKRLEQHRFAWPVDVGECVVTLTGRELNWLLDGIDVFSLQPHRTLSFDLPIPFAQRSVGNRGTAHLVRRGVGRRRTDRAQASVG